MKKFYVLVLSAMFAMGPMAVVAEGPQYAETDTEVEGVDTRGTVMIDDRFGVGDYIKMDKTFNNSLFLSGNTIVDKSNAVNGIGFFAGNQLSLSGNYEYGIHAADELIINSKYERDLFAVGNKILLSSDAAVARDAFIAGNEILIFTDIHGDAMLAGNKITLEDITIEGNLKVSVKEIEFRGEVNVKGEFVYNDNAIIKGDVNAAKKSTYHTPFIDIEINEMMVVCFQLAASIVVFLVFMFIARNFFNSLCESAKTSNGNEIALTFFSGVCAAIFAPVFAAILLLTIIGIPAGLILLLVWALLLALSSSACAAFIAAKVMPNMSLIISTILVLILFAVVSMIPYLNLVVKIAEICFGLGLIAKALFAENK